MEKTGFESRFFYLENIFFKQFWKTDFYTENSFFFQENSLKKKIILYRKQFLSCIEPCFKNQTKLAGPTSSTGTKSQSGPVKTPKTGQKPGWTRNFERKVRLLVRFLKLWYKKLFLLFSRKRVLQNRIFFFLKFL